MKYSITILHLYPKDMNIYGDNGNVIAIVKRLERRGIDAKVITYDQGDKFPDTFDILIGGGGQDSGQSAIKEDLVKIGPKIQAMADKGTPMLVICGLYQLFGKFFKTLNGEILQGIDILNIETYGQGERMIGNIITKSERFGTLVGYENHSGATFLLENCEPLARVIKGAGNNLRDNHEGAMYKNVIGSYMHGSMLPKNPQVADFLIEKALELKYQHKINLEKLDDTLADKARQSTLKRPR